MNDTRFTFHTPGTTGYDSTEDYGMTIAKKAINYHRSFPEYTPTPLADLKGLADLWGVKKILVKDESYRFGLNAFKSLGGSYAIGSYMAEQLEKDISEVTAASLASEETREEIGQIQFITATDGNHGRGIAWTVQKLNQKVKVYMPKGTVPQRVKNITMYDGEVVVTDLNFDDTARLAYQTAEENGWVLTQDTTSDPSYVKFPKWCMQGYTTMSYEAYEDLQALNEKPTHIFIQAGAGALAGSVVGFFSSVYQGADKPKIIIAEAENCDCLRRTAEANDGTLHTVGGDLKTIMAGLSVGEACSVGWTVLNEYSDLFAACSDVVAADGMRILAAPLKGDPQVISGESGALSFGLAAQIMVDPKYADIKEKLGIDKNSVILCFSTEGDTDPENYRRIVWKGDCSE